MFPGYPERETLHLGQVLATGERFDPHFNALLGKGLIASAVQGSGKSMLIGRIIEQAGYSVLSELSNAYFALVSNGRSNGYTVCFATQSLTYIAKWAIKSCQIKFYGRHVEKNDLNACEEDMPANVATRAQIESFAPGVGVVFGFTPTPMVVQFDPKVSADEAQTPRMAWLQEPAQRQEQEVEPEPGPTEVVTAALSHKLRTMSLDELFALIERLPEGDPTDSRYQQDAPAEKPVASPQPGVSSVPPLPEVKMPEQGKRAEEIDLRFAILAWNAGYNAVGKLEEYFGLTHNQAYKLYNTIKDVIKQQQQSENDEQ